MAKKGSWIKLDRALLDNDLWMSPMPFDLRSAWIDLLLSVNYTPHDFVSKGRTVHLEPGQMITSETILAERWHWSRGKVRRALKQLSEQGMIQVVGTAYGTTLTVVKWAFYQGSRTSNGTTDGTTDGTADGTLYKNVKNVKNVKKNNSNRPKPLEERLEGIRRAAKMGDENEKNRRDNQTG